MDKQKLAAAISAYTKKKITNAAYYSDNWKERHERKLYYYQSFTEAKRLAMTEEGLLEYMNYKSCGGAENGVTVKVTPFFCVQG